MAFADPQDITIAGVATSLPRTGSGPSSGTFASNDGNITLSVQHSRSKGGRLRHVYRIEHAKVTTDPFIPANNTQVGMSTYLVVDVPPAGYTVAQQKEVIDGFLAALSASSGSDITKLLGNET